MERISRIYVKNIDVSPEAFIEMIDTIATEGYHINKDTITIENATSAMLHELTELKSELAQKDKTIFITIGGGM